VNDVPIPPMVCTAVLCVRPPGGCSCVNHLCTRGILTQGQVCDLQHDACGNGLICCKLCGTPPPCTATPVCANAATDATGKPICPAVP
jgi:hypothetical protein